MNTPPYADLETWVAALMRPGALLELAVLAACVVLAWRLSFWIAKVFVGRDGTSIMFGRRIVDGVLFPTLLLFFAFLMRKVLAHSMGLMVFNLAIPVLFSLVCIRLAVKVLQAAFNETPLIRLLEHSISWLVWLALVLWVSGLLPLVMEELDQISWMVGGARLSVRKIIEGSLTAGLVLIIALWVSAAIESRLLRSAKGGELSLRMAVSNAARALLLFVGLLLALSAVGIDLMALSVLGGAIGVGIGFGLQKLAANYVSGFVILAERSMRIGDSVMVDTFTGIITEIKARYTVIRSLTGRESIVPNEMLITSRVENLSLADTRLWQSTTVAVGYDSDVVLVMRLLFDAAIQQERVLREPAPSVSLANFGVDGLEFTVGYWIADPENGSLNLKSAINLAILQSLRLHHIDIPYPQRVVHHRSVA
jgi:small-conductance mechanosensitive channel